MLPPHRKRRKPQYLKSFIVSKPKILKISVKSLYGVREWRRSVANLVALEMEGDRCKNFNFVVGLAPPQFITTTFSSNPKIRRKRITINGRKLLAKENVWRYKNNFPNLSPNLWNKKAYYNSYGEPTKHELIWISFKYNTVTKQLSISGKFKSSIFLSNSWKEI